jgi:hypothetical protein
VQTRADLAGTGDDLLERWIGQEGVGKPARRLRVCAAELGGGRGAVGFTVVGVDGEPGAGHVREARRRVEAHEAVVAVEIAFAAIAHAVVEGVEATG